MESPFALKLSLLLSTLVVVLAAVSNHGIFEPLASWASRYGLGLSDYFWVALAGHMCEC